MGYKEDFVVLWINAPASYSNSILNELAKNITVKKDFEEDIFDLIHIFSKSRDEIEDLTGIARQSIKQNGMIWLSWPKKASKVPTDLSDGVVRQIGLSCRLVDIKVAAIDEVWSGLKFVIRKGDRS